MEWIGWVGMQVGWVSGQLGGRAGGGFGFQEDFENDDIK